MTELLTSKELVTLLRDAHNYIYSMEWKSDGDHAKAQRICSALSRAIWQQPDEPSTDQSDIDFLAATLVDQESVLDECEKLLKESLAEDGVECGFDRRLEQYWQKRKALADWRSRELRLVQPPSALHSFKNFHRLLCERFGYFHDDQDWQRDQLSLIEYIASRLGQEPSSEFLSDLSNVLEMAKERESIFDMRSFIIDALTMIANHTVTKSAQPTEVLHAPKSWADVASNNAQRAHEPTPAIADEIKQIVERIAAEPSDPLEAVLDRADDKDYSDAGLGKMLRAYKNEIRATTLRNAERWRALVGCARVRILGSAGIRPANPSGHAHIAAEFWTHHDIATHPLAIEDLVAFADRAAQAKSAQPKLCGNPLPGKRGPCVMPDGHEGNCDDILW